MTVRLVHRVTCDGCGMVSGIDDATSVREARTRIPELGWISTTARTDDGSFERVQPGALSNVHKPIYDVCSTCRGSWVPPYLTRHTNRRRTTRTAVPA